MKVKYYYYAITATLILLLSVSVITTLRDNLNNYQRHHDYLIRLVYLNDLSNAVQNLLIEHQTTSAELLFGIDNQRYTAATQRATDLTLAIARKSADKIAAANRFPREHYTVIAVAQKAAALRALDADPQSALPEQQFLYNLKSSAIMRELERIFLNAVSREELNNPEVINELEGVRINGRLNFILTEMTDHLVDIFYYSDNAERAKYILIKLLGETASLSPRYQQLRQSLPRNDALDVSIGQIIHSIDASRLEQLFHDMIQNYPSGYLGQLDNANALYQALIVNITGSNAHLFNEILKKNQRNIYQAQVKLYGAISSIVIFTLVIVFPLLFLAHNIHRALESIHTSVMRLSANNFNLRLEKSNFGSEIDSVIDAIHILRNNQLQKLRLEHKNARLMAELEWKSNHDFLTGLYNRSYFFERLGQVMQPGIPVAVAILDIDLFKRINDTHGHDVGDRVLRHFSELLKDSFRCDDLFCRYGGEEFALALPNTSPQQAFERLDEFRQRVAEQTCSFPPADSLRYTISGGVSEARRFADIDRAIKLADLALYQAKEQGRNLMVLSAEGDNPSA